MLKRKFIDNIKKGLGSAYIELCNARDKEEYRDSLVYSITHSCTYDFIYEGSKGNYLYEMIGLFDDKNYFIDIVKNKLLNDYSINIDLQSQLLDILMADYYLGNEEVKYIIEEYYNNFIKIGRWTKRKIECYSYLCIKMSKLFGLKRVKLILKDWERYNINPSDYWFGAHVQFVYKKQNLIPEANKEDFIKKNYNHTFDEFLYLINNQEFVYCFSSFATDYENEKCNKYLAESLDKETIKKILLNYGTIHSKKKIDINVLFSLIDKFDDDINKEIYNLLAYYRHEKVINLAFELIDTVYFKIALHMLMTNYKKEYKEFIISKFKKIKYSFNKYEDITFKVIDFMYNNKKNMPDEILFMIYYNDYCAFNREYIVKCMNKRNLITKSIKEEILYDSDYDLRKYAKRYIK